MNNPSQALPEVFADAVLDLHFEAGVFRLTLAFAVPTSASRGGQGSPASLVPKAVLLLTEPAFRSLCEVVDAARQQMSEGATDSGTSPNFET